MDAWGGEGSVWLQVQGSRGSLKSLKKSSIGLSIFKALKSLKNPVFSLECLKIGLKFCFGRYPFFRGVLRLCHKLGNGNIAC